MITGAVDTITVPYGNNTNFFISAASVGDNQVESLFGAEYALKTGVAGASNAQTKTITATAGSLEKESAYQGIQLLQNSPNPFDLATMITVVSETDAYAGRAWIRIMSIDGRVLKNIKLSLRKGVNEVLYDHGYGVKGTFIYTLVIDGLPVQSRKMIFK
jgi:hypothetical protein